MLDRVEPGLFDAAVSPSLAKEFLADPRHHLSVALEDGIVVAFASGVHYVHPDKPAELFVNEVGVALRCRARGLGRAVLDALLAEGRRLGCRQAWVLTDNSNTAARALYEAAGGAVASANTVMYEFNLAAERDPGAAKPSQKG